MTVLFPVGHKTHYNIYAQRKFPAHLFFCQEKNYPPFPTTFLLYIPHPVFPGTYITKYSTFPHFQVWNKEEPLSSPHPQDHRVILVDVALLFFIS